MIYEYIQYSIVCIQRTYELKSAREHSDARRDVVNLLASIETEPI